MPLPRIISFVWVGGAMPAWAAENVAAFRALNPSHEVRVYDERAVHPDLASLVPLCTNPAQISDLVRYSVLAEHGGWHFDVDFVPFRPVTDMEGGWPGATAFVFRQQGHASGAAAPWANAPLACTAGHPMALDLIRRAKAAQPSHRASFGPPLVKDLMESGIATTVTPVPAAWAFPFPIAQIPRAYPALLHARHRLRLNAHELGGQVPLCAHLWAGAHDLASLHSRPAPGPAAIVQRQVKEQGCAAFAAGLSALGYDVQLVDAPVAQTVSPSLVVCWNGMRDQKFPKVAARWGVPCIRMEYGFLDRARHWQADHQGILHHASWASETRPSPCRGLLRLPKLAPDLTPPAPRPEGDILILGQLDQDTQLIGAPLPGMMPMLRAISRALPEGVTAVYRPHPQAMAPLRHAFPNISVGKHSDGVGYRTTKQGAGLSAELVKARFCVAMNSNALVEATAAGIPCAAFGPAVGLTFGVYHPLRLPTLAADLQEMLDGWAPDASNQVRFLATLAANQYSAEDFLDREVMAGILSRAGVAA